MNQNKLWILLVMFLSSITEISCFLVDYQPQVFARERYARSRAWPAGVLLDPITVVSQVLDFMAIVQQFGYPSEEHMLTTSDGYKLRIHRIPGSPLSPKAKGKPIVYFQHGLLASSDTWVLRGPKKDFAYMLADAGYDVWFGNIRGNTYSRDHVSLSPDVDPEFWDFSWHEMALYDITSVIDYILSKTDQKQLIYIGHSMGTTMSYVLLSMKPEYNERIKLLISLAPVAFWHGHHSLVVQFFINALELIKEILMIARLYEIFPLTAFNSELAMITCIDGSVFQPICLDIIYLVSGYNPKELNKTLAAYFLSHYPAGGSAKSFLHYGQNMLSGNFQMYDNGIVENFRNYGSANPPLYNLSNIVTPVALFYGKGDNLVSYQDPILLSKNLRNVVAAEAVPDEQFAHIDFIFAIDLKTLLLNRLMGIINQTLRLT